MTSEASGTYRFLYRVGQIDIGAAILYCAQLGRLDESQEWFKKAMAIDEYDG